MEDGTQSGERQIARLQAEVIYWREKARVDGPTGLYRREAFEEAANSPEAAGCEYILFDVDRFKSINTHEGYAVGDHVIIKAATAVALAAESEGFFCVGRVGGDEFAVLVPPGKLEAVDRIIRTAMVQFGFMLVGDRASGHSLIMLAAGHGPNKQAAELDLARSKEVSHALELEIVKLYEQALAVNKGGSIRPGEQ